MVHFVIRSAPSYTTTVNSIFRRFQRDVPMEVGDAKSIAKFRGMPDIFEECNAEGTSTEESLARSSTVRKPASYSKIEKAEEEEAAEEKKSKSASKKKKSTTRKRRSTT